MTKCSTCDYLIAFPTKGCKLKVGGRDSCEWKERFDALPILKEKEAKRGKKRKART